MLKIIVLSKVAITYFSWSFVDIVSTLQILVRMATKFSKHSDMESGNALSLDTCLLSFEIKFCLMGSKNFCDVCPWLKSPDNTQVYPWLKTHLLFNLVSCNRKGSLAEACVLSIPLPLDFFLLWDGDDLQIPIPLCWIATTSLLTCRVAFYLTRIFFIFWCI